MQPLNFSIDLCSVLKGALCPLPTYNFTGSDSLTVPSSINIASLIPQIAYSIPDLEAFAQLTLVEPSTGKLRACIQSTVSNGWSARQEAVEWSAGAVSLFALLSALWLSRDPSSLAPVRLLDLLYLFQAIASSGLLGLNYPSVYRAFTLNFSWALGLFPTSTSSAMQRSINSMRQLTGGDTSNSDGGDNAISLVNRKLSPYNVPSVAISSLSLTRLVNNAQSFAASLDSSGKKTSNLLVGGDVATVTQSSSNVLQAGIPIYVNSIGIATANAFMTIFFVSLILLAILLAILGLMYCGIRVAERFNHGRWDNDKMRERYRDFTHSWSLRVALVAFFPIAAFAFYQWTLKDSWLSILLSVILLIAIVAAILFPLILIFRRTRSVRAVLMVSPSPHLVSFISTLRPRHTYYHHLYLVAFLVKALFIAFIQSHGLVQASLVLATEVILLVMLAITRPHLTRGADVLAIYLAITRVVCAGLPIAFAESIGLAAIPRVVIGIVTAVIFSIAVVIMVLNIFVHAGLWRLLTLPIRRKRQQGAAKLQSKGSSSVNTLENGDKPNEDDEKMPTTPTVSVSTTQHVYSRPGNPTPSHTPTTGSLLSPLSATMSDGSHRPSMYSVSGSSTLGEQLPRRWSFQMSPPPSTLSISPPEGNHTLSSTPVSRFTTPRHSRHISATTDEQHRTSNGLS